VICSILPKRKTLTLPPTHEEGLNALLDPGSARPTERPKNNQDMGFNFEVADLYKPPSHSSNTSSCSSHHTSP